MAELRLVVAVFVLVAVSLDDGLVEAQVHHVVGGDRGWDPESGVGSWSSGRVFSVGDKLWFTYSAAQESIVELRTEQEYESCDVTNPTKMYTDGIDSLSLDQVGLRYFASSKSENCKNGLKLYVDVKPPRVPSWEIQSVATSEASAMVLAESPSSPSGSASVTVNWVSGATLGLLTLLAACMH